MLTKKIRILVIAGQLGLGGAERQLFYLLTQLDRQRFTIQVLNLNGDCNDYWAQQLVKNGIPVTHLPKQNRLKRLFKLWHFSLNWQPHILQSFHFYVNGYVAIIGWLNRYPTIGAIRSLPNENHIGQAPWFWQWLGLRCIDRLVCNSQAALHLLQQQFSGLDNGLVIPNGVSLPSSENLTRQYVNSKQELGKADDELYIGFVGSLNKNKNVSLLLSAVALIFKDFPQLRLILVGDGPLRDQLETEAKTLGIAPITRFVGQRPQAEELMPAFDILCLLSDYEGMPNVIMEAAAASISVVASKVGDVPLIVKEGETGLLFPPQDVEALAQCLHLLLADPELRQKMAVSARKHIETNYSIKNMVTGYEKLYNNLLSG